MSKKKVNEYSGKLKEVKQNDDDLGDYKTSDYHPESEKPHSSNISDDMDNRDLENDDSYDRTPELQQNDDDLANDNENDDEQFNSLEKDTGESNQGNHVSNDSGKSPNDIENSNNENSNENVDEDENNQENQNDESTYSQNDNGNDPVNSDDDDLEDNNISSQDDSDLKENTEDNDQSDEEESGDSSIKDKALDKIDPNLAKLSKFKDLSKMNKDDAKEEIISIAKSMAKKKIAATLATYVLPALLPILGILFILLMLIVVLVSVNNMMEDNQEQDQGCSVVDKASTNIKDSKNADKNAANIYKYTKKNVKGSTNKSIAAWLGNIYVESGGTFSSSTIQGGAKYKESLAKNPNAGGYAFGFAQLDSDRRVKLLKYADKKGKKWSDMDLQLDYILNHDGSDSSLIKNLIKQKSDIKGTTSDIMNKWERAGAKDSLPERQAAASKYYSKLSKFNEGSDSNISDATSSAGDNSDAGAKSNCNTDSDSKVDGELGSAAKANGKKGTIIEKWKSKKDIPNKYKKYITLPDYKGYKLNSSDNPFPGIGAKGQCTELTYSYMSQLYKGTQPTNGNGNMIYQAYKQKGAKVTSNPTVGYGFSANPPYAGAADASVGHTGVVIGVMKDGKFIISNYNLNGEANKDESRVETFALVNGNTKKGGIKFFSGVGGAKIKSK